MLKLFYATWFLLYMKSVKFTLRRLVWFHCMSNKRKIVYRALTDGIKWAIVIGKMFYWKKIKSKKRITSHSSQLTFRLGRARACVCVRFCFVTKSWVTQFLEFSSGKRYVTHMSHACVHFHFLLLLLFRFFFVSLELRFKGRNIFWVSLIEQVCLC